MKYPYKISIRELSERSGVKEKTIHKRIDSLRVSKKIIRHRNYDIAMIRMCDVQRILQADRFVFKNHSRKIDIIELHLKGVSANKIRAVLHLCKNRTLETIKEYKETGCVVVESQLNRMV